MKVLGLLDSFKGSLTSIELGRILKKELRKRKIACDYIPISDGGDGFLDSIEYIFKPKRIYLQSFDSLQRKIKTYYLYVESTKTAYIELAKASGINSLSKNELNPLITSTFGTGILILDAIKKGSKNIIIGLGGSSTNDGGSGLLNALGVKFFAEDASLIDYLCNLNLKRIKSIDARAFKELIKGIKITIISDVENPLLGPRGATSIFATQKGASAADLVDLEENLTHYADILEEYTNIKARDLPCSGAAGGVGYAFQTMFSAEFISGSDYLLDLIDFDNLKEEYDYLITGEGKIDEQSLAGKVVFRVLERAGASKVIFLCAINELNVDFLKSKNISKVYAIVNEIATVHKSLRFPKRYFKKLVRGIEF